MNPSGLGFKVLGLGEKPHESPTFTFREYVS